MPGVDNVSNKDASMISTLITPTNSNLLFKRLGHFSFDENSSSGYMTRELKTVYIDVMCQYFKITFHKCYENPQNTFNQVGLIRLQFGGSYIGEHEYTMIKEASQATSANNLPQYG